MDSEPLQPTFSRPLLLCVDDEPLILKLYEKVLGRSLEKQLRENALGWSDHNGHSSFFGFKLRLAQSGLEAVAIVEEELAAGNQFAVGFFDVRMPGISGIETIKRLYELEKYFQVVVVTGYVEEAADKFRSLPLCLDQLIYLNKPFGAQEILQIAVNQLSAWHLKKEHRHRLQRVQQTNQLLEDKVRNRTKDLMVSEAKFRNLVESAKNWIWNVSSDQELLFVNRGIGGYARDYIEQKGLQFLENLFIASGEEAVEQGNQPLTAAITRILDLESVSEELETSHYDVKTSTTSYYGHVLSPTKDDNRQIIGVLCITRDMSKEKVAELELIKKNTLVGQSNRSLFLLLDMSQTVSSCLEVNEILERLVKKLTININSSFCRIAFFDEELQRFIIQASFVRYKEPCWQLMDGLEIDVLPLIFIKKIAQTKQPIMLNQHDLQNNRIPALELMFLGGDRIVSGLLLPLVLKHKVIGLVYLGEYRSVERESFTPDKISLCQTILNNTVVAIDNARLFSNTNKMFLSTIRSLATTIDAKDSYTNNHSQKVAAYADILAHQYGLDDRACQRLRVASLLHDIGKIGIEDRILLKAQRLDGREFDHIKQHPEIGERILKPIENLKDVVSIIKHHHERFDGYGYPFGLKKAEIPLGSRIISIADSFDAMTSDRIYRSRLQTEVAFKEIVRNAGSQFDPDIVKTFSQVSDEIIKTMKCSLPGL